MYKSKIITIEILSVFFSIIVITSNIPFSQAVIVSDASQTRLFPGSQANLQVILKNNLNEDVTDVSFNLAFANTQFIPIGGSETGTDEIREGKSKTLNFVIKASQNMEPGNYNIPYTIKYTDANDKEIQRQGSIGVVVDGKTELDFSVETEKPVIGERGKITLKIINTGFGDIKFVNLKIQPQGFVLISSESEYIGSIDSDDFETSTFEVIFKNESAKLTATINYKDFNNNPKTEIINLPVTVYSKEKAIELGIIERDNTWIYVLIFVILIFGWFIYRSIRKKRKRNQIKEA